MYLKVIYLANQQPAGWGNEPPTGVEAIIWQAINGVDNGLLTENYVEAWWYQWSQNLPIIQSTNAPVGSVVFYDNDRGKVLSFLYPAQFKTHEIKKKIEAILPMVYNEQTGMYEGGDGESGTGSDCVFEDIPVFGNKFSFLCDVGKYLWAGIAIYTTITLIGAKDKNRQLLLGGIAAFSGYKAYQGFKK